MRTHFIKLFTAIALIAVFLLQAIWLYNMYTFLEKDLVYKLGDSFSQSFQKEVYSRLNDKNRVPPEGTVEGASPDLDPDTNAMYFNEFLTTHNTPIILEELDSIFFEKVDKEIGFLKYSLKLQDNKGQTVKQIYKGIDRDLSNPFFTKTIHIRINKSESIQLDVESPYKIIFQKMLLLLVASLVIGLIIVYFIFLQIKIINRQNRIAEVRKDFTHAMIHDMKNPMTTILMGVNALKGGKLDDKEILKQQYYEIMTKEGEHLLSLTNKILTIAQLEEKKVNLSKTDVSIEAMFDTLISKYELTSKKDLQIETNYNDVVHIYADKEYIYEVFINLIDNAVKYSKDNIVISIRSTKDIDNTRIIIKDNGIGMSLKDQQRIFDKFERVIAPKKDNKRRGFGLGLNYVYQTIKAHEGEVRINSILGEYSEFTIIIPNKDENKTSIN